MIDEIIQQYREYRMAVGAFMDDNKADPDLLIIRVEKIVVNLCKLFAVPKESKKAKKDEKEKKDKK